MEKLFQDLCCGMKWNGYMISAEFMRRSNTRSPLCAVTQRLKDRSSQRKCGNSP
jgi:hypothetical protein